MSVAHEPQELYDGPAVVHVDSTDHDVVVTLRGSFQPLDGLFHWYGRIERTADLVAAKDAGATAGELAIGDRAPATLRLAEYDPWGHVQVHGTGAPPYSLEPVEVELPA